MGKLQQCASACLVLMFLLIWSTPVLGTVLSDPAPAGGSEGILSGSPSGDPPDPGHAGTPLSSPEETAPPGHSPVPDASIPETNPGGAGGSAAGLEDNASGDDPLQANVTVPGTANGSAMLLSNDTASFLIVPDGTSEGGDTGSAVFGDAVLNTSAGIDPCGSVDPGTGAAEGSEILACPESNSPFTVEDAPAVESSVVTAVEPSTSVATAGPAVTAEINETSSAPGNEGGADLATDPTGETPPGSGAPTAPHAGQDTLSGTSASALPEDPAAEDTTATAADQTGTAVTPGQIPAADTSPVAFGSTHTSGTATAADSPTTTPANADGIAAESATTLPARETPGTSVGEYPSTIGTEEAQKSVEPPVLADTSFPGNTSTTPAEGAIKSSGSPALDTVEADVQPAEPQAPAGDFLPDAPAGASSADPAGNAPDSPLPGAAGAAGPSDPAVPDPGPATPVTAPLPNVSGGTGESENPAALEALPARPDTGSPAPDAVAGAQTEGTGEGQVQEVTVEDTVPSATEATADGAVSSPAEQNTVLPQDTVDRDAVYSEAPPGADATGTGSPSVAAGDAAASPEDTPVPDTHGTGSVAMADTVQGIVSPSENVSESSGTLQSATDTVPAANSTEGSAADSAPVTGNAGSMVADPETASTVSGYGVVTENTTVQVDTEVVIEGGSAGSAAVPALQETGPGILAAWLQDGTKEGEDGDPAHAEPGTQLLPPCTYEGHKDCIVWVVLRKGGSGAVGEIHCRGPMQETVPLAKAEFPAESFASATDAGRVSFGNSWDAEAMTAAIADQSAEVWNGSFSLAFDQEPGIYAVELRDTFADGTEISTMSVPLEYLAVTCYEFDFTAVSFGSITHGKLCTMEGDAEFGTSDRPTVRNIGNVPLRLSLWQDDMHIGKGGRGEWWVRYGVRLGDGGSFVRYSPEEDTVLPEVIGSGDSVPLSFSIETFFGDTGSYSGQITLRCIPAVEP